MTTEAEFQAQLVQLAELRGWKWVHFRKGRLKEHWLTPVSGPLGKGWPDLMLIRRDRIMFAELKRDGSSPTPSQLHVLSILSAVAPTFVWRPKDWAAIETVLR